MASPDVDIADLSTCDDEPIHIPGSIQPHGALLALSPGTLRIEQAAGNTSALIGAAPKDLPGSSIEAWFSPQRIARLRDALALQRQITRSLPIFAMAAEPGEKPVDALVFEENGTVVLELEAADPSERDDTLAVLEQMERHVQGATTVLGLCQAAAEALRTATGFDRVMVYRFLPDGSGVVDGEARGADIDSFLGLHYPASDIPRQARALYLRNWLRLISDIAYEPAPIYPALNPSTGQPLDLSQSVLRSVSPVHLEYLANMGVAASMSVSIVRQGQLWGLIACHHYAPKYLPLRLRIACELFAAVVSLRMEAGVAAEDLFGRLAAKQTLETMMLNLAPEMDLAEGLTHFQPNLLDLIPVGGVTLWFGGKATSIGRTPNAEQVASLVDWLEIRNENVFDTDQLSLLHPPAAAYSAVASGVLAISLSKSPRDYVLWFLPAVARTVTWAGNPNKTEQPVSPGKRLTPRASFAAWRELVRDHSRAWQSTETEAAESLRTAVLVLRRIELYASEKAASRVHQDTLMAELDHRVKNILATIQALAAQSHADSDTIESFLATFEGRLRSMSRAHSLLTLCRWEGADLRSLITEEMAPFMGRPGLNVVIAEGETIILRPKAALALSLGIHELATNAAKYGALSVPDGCIKIDWRVGQSPEQTLVIHWRESGGPAVLQPARHGFGTTLIESSLSYELGGVVTLDFLAEGVSCTVVMPWDQVVGSYVRPAPVSPPLGSEVPVLTGLRVLVVEDNALVVQTTVGFLQKFGASVVGPAPRLTAATQLAEAAAIDIAMLDIDLDGTRVWPAADILARRGVPFLFVTGFAANLVVPPRFADRTVLTKPYSSSDLGAALGRLLATRPTVRPETEIQTQA